MKEPLKIGDRVRIFDMCEVTHSVTEDKGKVLGIFGDRLLVRCDTWQNTDAPMVNGNYFHKKQCRRLRPKKKRVKKTVERWAVITKSGKFYTTYDTKEDAESHPAFKYAVKLTGEYWCDE